MQDVGFTALQELNYRLSFDTTPVENIEYRLWRLYASKHAEKKGWYCEILASWPDRFVEACMKHRFDIDAMRSKLALHGVRCDTVDRRRVYRFRPFLLGKTRKLERDALDEYDSIAKISRRKQDAESMD